MVSLVEAIRLSLRDRFSQRVATLRGAAMTLDELVRPTQVPWYDRVGELLAKSPLVGVSEQRRLAAKLAMAGISGRGRLETFIAIRSLCALAGIGAAWLALASVDLPAKVEAFRYVIMVFGLVPGWRLPDIVLNVMARRRKLRLEAGFPDALDLLVICAEAGLGLEQAIGQVAHDMRFATPDVAAEFATTADEMRIMADRQLPLEHLAERTGLESLRGMISILNQSIKFGTPLSDALRQLTAEARMVRVARMEERGARLSVTLLLQ